MAWLILQKNKHLENAGDMDVMAKHYRAGCVGMATKKVVKHTEPVLRMRYAIDAVLSIANIF